MHDVLERFHTEDKHLRIRIQFSFFLSLYYCSVPPRLMTIVYRKLYIFGALSWQHFIFSPGTVGGATPGKVVLGLKIVKCEQVRRKHYLCRGCIV